jgi:hypothetical protein
MSFPPSNSIRNLYSIIKHQDTNSKRSEQKKMGYISTNILKIVKK